MRLKFTQGNALFLRSLRKKVAESKTLSPFYSTKPLKEFIVHRPLVSLYCFGLLASLFFHPLGVCAQAEDPRLLSGKMIDLKQGTAVAYGTVRIEGQPYGAVSNAEGEFDLRLPKELVVDDQVLVFSAMGYANHRVLLRELAGKDALVIRMEEKPFALSDVWIYGTSLSAAEMVQEAFARVPDNYPIQPYLLHTFYRHYCQEDGDYGRLIEAAVDLYDEKGYKRMRKAPDDKIQMRVRQLRRSYDFTSVSARAHAPISVLMTLESDMASYKSVLSLDKGGDTFTYQFTDTTFFDDQVVYVIRASSNIKGIRQEVDLYLTARELAFVRIWEQTTVTSLSSERKVQVTRHNETTYQLYEGRYYLRHLINEGFRETAFYDSAGVVIHEEGHRHHVEIMVNEVETGGFVPFRGKEPDKTALLAMTYDPVFWDNYNLLKATPLERKIESDLAARMPLESQFANFNRQVTDPDYQDRVQAETYEQILAHNRGKLIFVYFWRSDKLPGLRDLLLARKLVKQYHDRPVALVFISFDESEESWQKTIDKWGLYAGSHLRLAKGADSRLARKLGVTDIPYYLVIDRQGNTALKTEKLPANAQLKAEIERIMNL
jgi:hypothetical protein